MNKNFNIIVYLVIISIILIVSSILTIFIVPNYFQEYARVINLMVWIVLFILSVPIENEHSKFKGKKDKIKTTLIIIIIYYMLYFLLGLVFGYQRSPYSRTVFGILKNTIFIVGTVALKEFVRSKFINADKKMSNHVIVTIIFVLINLDYNNFTTNFENNESIFKFIASNLIPQIAISCVCTYFAKAGGYKLIYAYRLPITIATILIPIFPDVDWFFTSMLDIIIAIVLIVYINYEHIIKINRLTRKQKKDISPQKTIIYILAVFIFVVFISGILPYKPLAVMSNSMVPEFSRGYVVIVRSIKENDIESVKIGDIIQYQLDDAMIIHRVIEIEKDENGKNLYIAKGDNNISPDFRKVEETQVRGVVKFKVPYIGYPSVWFSELLFKNKPDVQT